VASSWFLFFIYLKRIHMYIGLFSHFTTRTALLPLLEHWTYTLLYLTYFVLPLEFYFKYFPIQFISSYIHSFSSLHPYRLRFHSHPMVLNIKIFFRCFFVSDRINNIYLASSSPKLMGHPPARCLTLKPLVPTISAKGTPGYNKNSK
jgi:hypothetical protein